MSTPGTIRKTHVLVLLSGLFLAHLAYAETCLWKAASPKGMLYVLGSIHVLKPENYPLPSIIETAYTESSNIVFEVDMRNMMSPQTQQLIMTKALLQDDVTLESLLSQEVYKSIEEELSALGLPISAFNRFKPWFVGMTLTLTHMQRAGFKPELGVDRHIHQKALAQGKAIRGLETVQFQIDLIDSLAESNQNHFMKRTLKDLELIDEQIGDLQKAWEKGNLEEIGALMHESFKEFPVLYNRFVADRNKTWANQLDSMVCKDAPLMVVVGAA
ncbi:MAG: TraB/GumN family protein, partial [Pontiella sp.]|nr:TraB/GumN family protein [Pontiella sp.]